MVSKVLAVDSASMVLPPFGNGIVIVLYVFMHLKVKECIDA